MNDDRTKLLLEKIMEIDGLLSLPRLDHLDDVNEVMGTYDEQMNLIKEHWELFKMLLIQTDDKAQD